MDKIQARKRIYLAGKIAKNDWRCAIVQHPGFWNWAQESVGQHDLPERQWPILERAIFQRFDYVGPFFMACDHGCYHAPGTHGILPRFHDSTDSCANVYPQGRHGGCEDARGAGEPWVVQQCLSAIHRADLVFAWVTARNCYATFAEIGYAHALGRQIVGFMPYDLASELLVDDTGGYWHDDLWFLRHLVTWPGKVRYETPFTPASVLEQALTNLGWFSLPESYESPLEQLFAEEWVRLGYHNLYPLTYQHEVNDGKYRLDFAYTPATFAIELDGYSYHNSPDQFTKDRQRQRELEAHGWRFVRFSGSEITNNIAGCVQEAMRLLDMCVKEKRHA